jgi:hypothetical protein
MLHKGKLTPWLLLIFLAGCGRARQVLTNEQQLSQSVSPTDTTEATLVSARVTRVDGRQPIEPGTLAVPNAAEIEVEVVGLPSGSSVYVGARVPGGVWHLRPAPASVEPTGRFRSRGEALIPGTSQVLRSCQIVAVILNAPPDKLVMDDASLAEAAEKVSAPVNVDVEAEVSSTNPAKLAITAIQDQLITAGVPAIVPLTLTVKGTAAPAVREKQIYLAFTDANGLLRVLEPPAVAGGEDWQISLTLPPMTIRQLNVTRLIAVASDRPPPTDPQPLAAIEKWALAHSLPITIVIHPIALSIESLVDGLGHETVFGDNAGPTEEASISSDSAQISVLSDNPYDNVPVFFLMRPEGQDLWLAFGPAIFVAPGQWKISSAKLNVSGPGRWLRSTIQAVASMEALNGRAFTDEQLQQLELGSSSPRMIKFDPAGRRSGTSAESIEFTPGDQQLASGRTDVIDLTNGVDGHGVANLAPDTHLGAGVRCMGSQIWKFEPLIPAKDGTFRVTALPKIDCPQTGSNVTAEFRLVAAKVPLNGYAEGQWVLPFTVADSGAPIPVITTNWPWLTSMWEKIAGTAPAQSAEPLATMDSTNIPLGDTTMIRTGFSLPSLMIAAGLIATGLLALYPRAIDLGTIYLWVWWNARRDAKAGIPAADSKALSPVESRLVTRANRRVMRAAKKPFTRIAVLRGHAAGYGVPKPAIPRTWHAILLALFFVGEAAFNLTAFNVFREPMLMTFLMAIPVGIGVPLCAMYVGRLLINFATERVKNTVIILLVLLVVSASLYGINVARVTFLRYHAPQYVQQNPGLGVAFFVLAIFIFVATTVTTIMAHPHVEDKTQAEARAQIRQSLIDKLQSKIEKEKGKILGIANLEETRARELMYKYRGLVMRVRKDVPLYFKEDKEAANKLAFINWRQWIDDKWQSPYSDGGMNAPMSFSGGKDEVEVEYPFAQISPAIPVGTGGRNGNGNGNGATHA